MLSKAASVMTSSDLGKQIDFIRGSELHPRDVSLDSLSNPTECIGLHPKKVSGASPSIRAGIITVAPDPPYRIAV
jgi:hypothetical protein